MSGDELHRRNGISQTLGVVVRFRDTGKGLGKGPAGHGADQGGECFGLLPGDPPSATLVPRSGVRPSGVAGRR